MEEFSIEEKAKRYDEALKVIKECIPDENGYITIYPQEIFLELKESEDEKIRKYIIKYFEANKDELSEGFKWNGITVEECLAWLEKHSSSQTGTIIPIPLKQGEQKPKFKIGDTIKKESTGDIVTISEIDLKNREYRLSNTGFIPFKYEYLWELVEQKPVEWSEEDEDVINLILSICNDFKDSFDGYVSSVVEDDIKKIENWLESLRPQSHWKPTEEQIDALESATTNCAYSEYQDCLRELIKQLKKLRG